MTEAITKYYRNEGLTPGSFLARDLKNKNMLALSLIEYAVKHLIAINGISNLLRETALVDKPGNEGLRIYHNYLQQFHAIYFTRNKLRHRILEVESKNNKIISPFGQSNKSCDIKTCKAGRDFYFDSKDRSSIFYASNSDLPKFKTEEDEAGRWIINMSKDADLKGANYLICRPDFYVEFCLSPAEQEHDFYYRWIMEVCKKHFPISKRISKNVIVVSPYQKIFITF